MATVLFVVHPGRPDAAILAEKTAAWLKSRGHQAVWAPEELVAQGPEDEPPAMPKGSREIGFTDDVDLAVSLGGDGTMLRAVELASGADLPVLGVNLGRLGYLTEVEPSGLQLALGRFLDGDFTVEERMTLEVSVEPDQAYSEAENRNEPADRAHGPHGKVPAATYLALNEAAVEKTVPGHTIRLASSIAGRPFITYAADGLLVATPTGSTAYNLSARGPILSPSLRAIVVTPLSPHMLFDRALVLEPDESLRLEVAGPRPGVLVIDGLTAGILVPGDAVVCRVSKTCARLVSFAGRDFYSILKARFGLTDR